MSRADAGSEAGFTLMESLAGVAATGAVVAGLALATGQWLPTWRHGFANLQTAESLAQGLDRLAADFAAARYARREAQAPGPLFVGDSQSATFVRPSLDPNAPPGLEIVRYAETKTADGLAMTRLRARFEPGAAEPAFGAAVAVARAPFRLTFAYAGEDRAWRDTWPPGPKLPKAVRISVRDAASGALMSASTATVVHATAPAPAGGGAPNARRSQQ